MRVRRRVQAAQQVETSRGLSPSDQGALAMSHSTAPGGLKRRSFAVRPPPDDTSFPIVNAYWARDELVLVVADPSSPNGVRFRRGKAEHSCFIRLADLPDPLAFHRMLNSHHSVRKALFEDDWLRVCWRGRDELKSRCKSLHEKGIPTFEGAVSPVLRHMVDNRLKPGAPRQLWVDIESDSRVPFSRKEEMRVLCWVCVDADGNEYRGLLDQDTDADEARLLIELWEVFEHYDQIMAWNGDRFDFPLIKARSELHKLLPPTVREWRRWLWLDHLELFKRLNMQASESGEEKQSFKLGVVAESVLGVGQGKIAFDASKTWDEWAAGGARRQRLLDYCAQDTQLMPAIEAKTGYILLLQAVSDTCGTFADSRGVNPSVQVEGFLARLALDRGYKFPTVLKLGEESLRYEGAYVLHPQKHAGIHRDVHVADFAGLYPSIIRTWNMSPETLLTDEMDPEVTRGLPVALSPLTMRNFRTDIPGILPEAVKQLMTLRSVWQKRKAALPPGTDEWKDADRRAGAYKITTNSFYGVIGSPNSRFYDRRVAESVTQCGRWLIVETIKVAERRGMKVIYGDTDSLFVTGSTRGEFEAFVAWCNAELYPELLAKVGCVENVISLAYEKQFSRLVITTAKKYCNPPETPIWMADGTFKQLGDVEVGDVVMGWTNAPPAGRRKLVPSEVVATHHKQDELVRVRFESGRELRCTPDHQWLRFRELRSHRGETSYSYPWATAREGRELVHVAQEPRTPRYVPASFATPDRVVEVEPDGYGRVIGMTTSTGNYVAWGYASKNCGQYSHYKGTDATSDSHPEIKGLEFKRGDSLRITRALQEDLTNLLVGYKRPFSDDPEDYVAIIVRWRGRVLLDRLELGDVLVSKRLGKSLDDYKADSAPMVRIARELEARGQDVGEGAKIDYVVIDAGVSPQVVIPADDYDPDAANLIDRAALWDKLIWPASLRLMEAAFPGYNWAEQGGLVKARKVAAKAQAVPKVKKRR